MAAVWNLKIPPLVGDIPRRNNEPKDKRAPREWDRHLYAQERANSQERWYGRRHLGGRRPNCCLGPERRRGTNEGLTRTQAEAKLRQLIVRERPPLLARASRSRAPQS